MYGFRDTTVRISHLFHGKQILLVIFRLINYFIGSNDLYNLERFLVSFTEFSLYLNSIHGILAQLGIFKGK